MFEVYYFKKSIICFRRKSLKMQKSVNMLKKLKISLNLKFFVVNNQKESKDQIYNLFQKINLKIQKSVNSLEKFINL